MWDDHSHFDALFIQEGIMLKRNVLNYPALWRGNAFFQTLHYTLLYVCITIKNLLVKICNIHKTNDMMVEFFW